MSSASIPIFTEAGSNTVRLSFRFTARAGGASPVSGEEFTVLLEGDGSLAPRHNAKQILRTTGPDGTAEITWYRRGIYGRDVHATLSVESGRDDCTLKLEANAPASAS